jgi:hypothetical protein
MLSWSSEDGWEFSLFGAILVTAVIAFTVYRNRVRRKSLRKRDDGTYIWLEWHGGERTSHRDPSEKGGEWDSDGDGDGGD